MPKLRIERIGGLAGFGGKSARLRSLGEMDMDELSGNDRQAIERLFATGGTPSVPAGADRFRYRISRQAAGGTASIEVDEDMVPAALKQCLRDELL